MVFQFESSMVRPRRCGFVSTHNQYSFQTWDKTRELSRSESSPCGRALLLAQANHGQSPKPRHRWAGTTSFNYSMFNRYLQSPIKTENFEKLTSDWVQLDLNLASRTLHFDLVCWGLRYGILGGQLIWIFLTQWREIRASSFIFRSLDPSSRTIGIRSEGWGPDRADVPSEPLGVFPRPRTYYGELRLPRCRETFLRLCQILLKCKQRRISP